jgi:hypothetical protein
MKIHSGLDEVHCLKDRLPDGERTTRTTELTFSL